MPEQYQTNAINIHSYNLSENDKIIVMYSKDNGIIRCVAKGVKKPKSKLGGRMDLLINNNLILSKGKNLDIVSQAEVVNSFKHIRLDFSRLGFAMYSAELIGIFGSENDPNSELIYELFLDTLGKIDETSGKSNLLDIIIDFQLKLMDITGYKLSADCCSCCGKPYDDKFRFSVSSGGMVCSGCAGFNSISNEKTQQIYKVLNKKSTDISLAEKEYCFEVLKDYITYHSDKKIKTLSFLSMV